MQNSRNFPLVPHPVLLAAYFILKGHENGAITGQKGYENEAETGQKGHKSCKATI